MPAAIASSALHPDVSMLDSGDQLASALQGRYVLERELGRGGMALVYLAQDLRHDRQVALKVLHPELAQVLGTDRFLREIRTSARLQHPHILGIHDSGEAAGRLWFTMPFVEGETLRSRMNREKQLPLTDALRITAEAADALDYAHEHGVIHRDIKPENILLSGRHVFVADFGIARTLASAGDSLTATGMTVGTPAYMSPEQASGEREVDGRSDVYSLGTVLYEMLAGEPPFTGTSAQALIAKRLTGSAPLLSASREVPLSVERAVSRALARAPVDRFATAREFADALQAPSPDSSGETRVSQAARGRRNHVGALALSAALLIALLGGYLTYARSRPGATAEAAASAAVLPFSDLSPGKDQEYFSDGLTDELITSLSQVKGLRVAARTSSFQFKGRNADVREVGRKLDVSAVLEGSVRRSGDHLRVTAQLSSVKDGYQLWSDSYDRKEADVFAVQEDIARSIVSALRVRLGGGTDSVLASKPTEDLEAYDLYLKGRFAWNQRTPQSLQEAARYLEQAVARDSGFTRAWAALADTYILLGPYTGLSPKEIWPKGKAAAERALRLDPESAEARTSLAYGTLTYEWDWPVAEENFKRAIAAKPNYATAHHWYADLLAGRGRLDESLREMTRAHELDPLSLIIDGELAWVYYLMHRTPEAEAQVRRVLELDRNYAQSYYVGGLVELQAGRPDSAIALTRRCMELGDPGPQAWGNLANAYARAGKRGAALRMLGDLQRESAHAYVPPFAFALAYAALGDNRRGVEWLQRGVQEKDVLMPENFQEPLLDPLREGQGYAEVLRGMELSAVPGSAPAR
ncbi:MAG TPA: protein kinase [Gemmatimonadales bacterium]